MKKPLNLTSPTKYPIGSFVRTESGYFYIKSDIKRYRLLTRRVLDSWTPPRLIVSSESAVVKYKIAGRMGFRDGSLIHNIGDGRIYLISESKRRHITSPDVLARIGATRRDIVEVSQDEINLQEEGAELT